MLSHCALAQISLEVVKIGVLTDPFGPAIGCRRARPASRHSDGGRSVRQTRRGQADRDWLGQSSAQARRKTMPTMWQPGVTSSVPHEGSAARAVNTDEPLKVVAKMRERAVDGVCSRNGSRDLDLASAGPFRAVTGIRHVVHVLAGSHGLP
jgi:hypothetical protein